MASIQARKNRGKKYWYIVESKRVNGKPRPIVIECLGSTEQLINRLQNKDLKYKKKSFSHGSVAVILNLARKLDVVSIINKHTKAKREYWSEKPLRNKLTAGITMLLVAIGRICSPTSKRDWHNWAAKTTCDYLLRISFSKLDSQHFWDLMDCIPEKEIENIELEILQNVSKIYPLNEESLSYDTSNFFTFIDSDNGRCDIAKRGKNKQKRNDLRQIGLALTVTQKNFIPLIHHTYQGNISDCKVFAKIISTIKKRMQKLNMNISNHTIVFDRGCNSKINLKKVERLKLYYVGALTPTHHKDLLKAAEENFITVKIDNVELEVYRETRLIWGSKRTVLVFISQNLKEGQLRGVYQTLERKKKRIRSIQRALSNPRAKKRTREQIENLINKTLQGQFMEGLIDYKLLEKEEGRWLLTYRTNKKNLILLEDRLGFRIIMTNRHDWSSDKIISTFHGQAAIEQAFKDIKNPYHLAITPEFHWTDQKIKVHYFCCILGYLLASLIAFDVRKDGFKGSLDTLFDHLNNIRLSREITLPKKQGKPKVVYQLEEMSNDEQKLAQSLKLSKIHLKPIKISGVGVYN